MLADYTNAPRTKSGRKCGFSAAAIIDNRPPGVQIWLQGRSAQFDFEKKIIRFPRVFEKAAGGDAAVAGVALLQNFTVPFDFKLNNIVIERR